MRRSIRQSTAFRSCGAAGRALLASHLRTATSNSVNTPAKSSVFFRRCPTGRPQARRHRPHPLEYARAADRREHHLHQDCTGDIAVIHNGIIENYQSLRDGFVSPGHSFTSKTDTGVVLLLIEDALDTGADPEDGVREVVRFSEEAVINGDHAVVA